MATATRKATKSGEKVLTQPVEVPTIEGRVKHVWRDSQECAHRWASGAHDSGRAGNVFFRGATIYSYGTHFPMAQRQRRVVKGKPVGEPFVLVTTRTYSVSTSSHQSDVRTAVRGQTVYRVHTVNANTVAEHLDNLKEREESALEYCRKAKTARQRKAEYEAEAVRIIKEANEYAEAVGLKERLTAPKGTGDLAKWAAEAFAAEKRAAELAKKAESVARAKYAKVVAGRVAEWEQKVNAWRDGAKDEPGRCPDHTHPLAQLAFLRVKGSVLETSMRVAVPLKAALPILALVRSGKVWDTTQFPDDFDLFSIDGFQLRSVDPVARRVLVGCHVVTFEEIERLAATLGL